MDSLRRLTYITDEVNTQMECISCPAGEGEGKVMKDTQTEAATRDKEEETG